MKYFVEFACNNFSKSSLIRGFLRHWRLSKLSRVPAEIAIETTNICNLDCIMCPRKAMDRPQKIMDFDLYEKIVDDAVDLGIKNFLLHNYGEPLLISDASFDNYLSYLRYRDKNAYVNLDSNGTLLTDNKINILCRNRVNKISLTLDGATPETYERIRRGAKLEEVENNVFKLMAYKKQHGFRLPVVSVAIIRMRETEDEINLFIDKWRDKVDEVHVTGYTNRGGTLSSEFDKNKSFQVPCFRIWKQMVVNNDGSVALCCNDWNVKYKLGDLMKQTITEVWTGHKIENYRFLNLTGQRDTILICRACKPEIWDSFPLYWFWKERELRTI